MRLVRAFSTFLPTAIASGSLSMRLGRLADSLQAAARFRTALRSRGRRRSVREANLGDDEKPSRSQHSLDSLLRASAFCAMKETAMASTNRTIEGHHITGMTVSGWRVVWGVLLIIAGVLAVLMPGVAALATAFAVVMLPLAGDRIPRAAGRCIPVRQRYRARRPGVPHEAAARLGMGAI